MPKTGSEVDQKNPDPNSAFRTDFEPFTGSVWPPEQRRMKRRGKRILRPWEKVGKREKQDGVGWKWEKCYMQRPCALPSPQKMDFRLRQKE